jgi:hypothetical protein
MSESNEIYAVASKVAVQSIGLGPSVHIPLRDAFICATCDTITNSGSVCPGCADTSLIPLATMVQGLNS